MTRQLLQFLIYVTLSCTAFGLTLILEDDWFPRVEAYALAFRILPRTLMGVVLLAAAACVIVGRQTRNMLWVIPGLTAYALVHILMSVSIFRMVWQGSPGLYIAAGLWFLPAACALWATRIGLGEDRERV